jgi:outer membrane protein OmpA-like peptidoglycan-associated protein
MACGEVLHVSGAKIPKVDPPAPVVASAAPAPLPVPKKAIKLAANTSIEGDQIKIKGRIEFDTDRATLRLTDKETTDALQSMLQVLKENPHVTKLKVEGHTDNRGTAEKNKKLSMERAESVIAWFVKNGVESGRLQPFGYGAERPKDTNDTDAGRKENRRVEFHIGEMDGKPYTP